VNARAGDDSKDPGRGAASLPAGSFRLDLHNHAHYSCDGFQSPVDLLERGHDRQALVLVGRPHYLAAWCYLALSAAEKVARHAMHGR